MTFTAQPPAGVQGNVVISPAVQVAIRDASGSVVPTGTVTLSVGNAPWPAPGSRLLGSVTVAAVNGIATFANLRVDKPGTGYTLVATSGAASSSSVPFNVGLTITGLGAGGLHTCGTTTGGTYCWGYNLYGQLGSSTGARIEDSVPVLVSSSESFTQVVGAQHHSCALSASGAVYCWGENDQGELGVGTLTGPGDCYAASASAFSKCYGSPVRIVGPAISLLTFTSVSSGPQADHTCALAGGGAVYCWGYNTSGQVGDGAPAGLKPTPVQVAGSGMAPLIFSAVSAGGPTTCGVTTNGAAYCWGWHYPMTPTQVAGSGTAPLTFTAITARRMHVCAVTTAGAVYCWGSNFVGQLGDGTTTGNNTPVQVVGSGTAPLVFTSISGGDLHTCGVTTTGQVYCWGLNVHGALGDGTTTDRTTPVLVAGSGTPPLVFSAVSGGEEHTCGLTAGGMVYCWGYGEDGEIGNGARTDQLTPVPIVQ